MYARLGTQMQRFDSFGKIMVRLEELTLSMQQLIDNNHLHLTPLNKSEREMIVKLSTLRKTLSAKFVAVNKKKFPERLVNFVKNSFEFRCLIGSEASEEIKSEWLSHKDVSLLWNGSSTEFDNYRLFSLIFKQLFVMILFVCSC